MAQPRQAGAWPSAGERQGLAVVQYATVVTDALGGRSDPTWTTFASSWHVKVTVTPFVVSDTQAAMLYQIEGPYRADVVSHYDAGRSLRVLVHGFTLKVIELENPQLRNRTVILHCGKATTT